MPMPFLERLLRYLGFKHDRRCRVCKRDKTYCQWGFER